MGAVLFGYGNPSRGDDALGPLLLERAETWLADHPGAGIELVADFQLQIEHVLDLEPRDLALFLDADVECLPPFRLREVHAAEDTTYTTHELSPEALLQVYSMTLGRRPPVGYLLSVRGYSFDLGEPLSEGAQANLDQAWAFLQELLSNPRAGAWSEAVGRSPRGCRFPAR